MPTTDALAVVVVTYLLTVLVLWLLSLLGPVAARMEGTVAHARSHVWFPATGTVAAFVLIAALGIAATKWLMR